MNQRDWQRAFGDAPEDFRLHLHSTLDGLEEKDMKKRFKFSMVLIAAALCLMLLAGAGIAATKLGIFDFLINTAKPITPLPGAEALVGTNLGTTENALVSLNVEEAVFDGQSVLIKMRIAPKDAEHYAMFNSFMQNSTDEFKVMGVPDEVPQGIQELGGMKIVNENDTQQLLKDGREMEIPFTAEEAQEKGYPIYLSEGKLYYANQRSIAVIPRENARKMIDYWQSLRFPDGEMADYGADAEGQADGSVIIWMDAMSQEALDQDSIRMQVSAEIADPDGNDVPLEPVMITLPMNAETKHVRLEPVGDGKGDHFQIYSGEITFTKVRGYIKLQYSCELNEESAPMGISFSFYDKEGNRITTGSGSTGGIGGTGGILELNQEIQSFESIPEVIFAEARIIDGRVLDRIECKVIVE